MLKIKKIILILLLMFTITATIFFFREKALFTARNTSEQKKFTYAMEHNNVSIYLLNTNNYIYPNMEMELGNYFSIISLASADGQVMQYHDFWEFQFTYFFKGIQSFNNVFRIQEGGKYKLVGNSLGNALQLHSIINHNYYQISSVSYQDEILQFCNVEGEFNGTVLIRKSMKTNKELHYYFDGNYNIHFPENTQRSKTNYIYISKSYEKQGISNKLEIWKYNLFDSSMILVDSIETTFDSSHIAVNDKNEIFVAFALKNKKTWGVFLNTGKSFESTLVLAGKPIFKNDGVYLSLKYCDDDISRINSEQNKLYLVHRNGTMQFIENQPIIGTICDNMIISMFPSERYDYLGMIVEYRDMNIPNSENTKVTYPPKKKDDKNFHLLGWSYEEGTIYGYYVSEDGEDVEKFVVK